MPTLNISQLPKCKGKLLTPKGGVRECPVHKSDCLETDWIPPEGIDPQLREFQCTARGLEHAIYNRKITHFRQKEANIRTPLKASFSCIFCAEYLPNKKSLEEHILIKHSGSK